MSPGSTFNPVAALQGAAAAAKTADPQTVVGAVKASSSYHEAVTNVQAIAAFGNTAKLYKTITRLQPSTQAAAWQALNSGEQDMLSAMGYHAPDPAALTHIGAGGDHGGIWSAIASGVHTAADWAHSAFDNARHTVAEGADKTLSALGAPIRAIQHVYRAGNVLSEEGLASKYGWTYVERKAQSSGATLNPAAFSDIFSPSAWAQAWRHTTTGTTTLDPALSRTLTSKYGKPNVQLALRVLKTGATSVVKGTPAKTRPALVRTLSGARFHQMLTEVQNARMSFGRSVVGSKYMNTHPTAGKVLSGGLDAAFDFAATPLNKAGEAVTAAREGMYGIDAASVGSYLAGDASRMDAILNSGSVRRYVEHVGKFLERGDYEGLGKFDPRLENVASQLADEGVDSADAFHDWLSGNAGLYAVLSGKAARISDGVAIMPHLTIAGWLKTEVKEALQGSLDRLADGKVGELDVPLDDEDVAGAGDMSHQHTVAAKATTLEQLMRSGALKGRGAGRIPAVSNLARWIRRVSTLIPTKPYVDIGTDADVPNLRRYLQGFLPARRVNDVVNVFLDSDLGTRYRIVTAAREQMFHALGAYGTPQSSEATRDMLGALGELEREQAYSIGGLDQMVGDDGRSFNAAVLDDQLSPRVAIPLPNQLRRVLREQTVLAQLHLNPLIAATRFMYFWRTLILDRPGFAVRFGITESLSRLLRTGPGKFMASFAAAGAGLTRDPDEIASEVDRMISTGELDAHDRDAEIAAQMALAHKPLTPYHPVERALAVLADRVPEGLRPYIDTPAKFYGAVVAGGMRRVVRELEAKGLDTLGMDRYVTAATHLYTHQPVQQAFEDVISMMQGSHGYMWTPETGAKAARNDAESVIAAFRAGSHYSEAAANDPNWRLKWQFALDQVAHSQLGRAVLESIDRTERTQERAVLRVLNDPAFADTKAQFARASRLPDGRVAGIDATQEEADKAFARVVRKHVNALVRSGDPVRGPVLSDLVDEMLSSGRGPVRDSLDAIAQHDLPASVYGPDSLAVHQHEGILSKSWETLVGKPANWLFRQPHFIQAYAEALPAAREYAYGVITDNPGGAEKLASDLATDRAVNAVLPYIHNPALRTQFEDTHRILFPFLFAQRQFLQRWGRLVLDSPDAIRKIQLTMNGLRTAGFIRKDSNGQTYFYYPGSQYPQELITHVLTKLGVHASVPMVTPFTGQVQYLMAGLSNPVTPSVGPFAAVSLQELGKLMPELKPEATSLLGPGSTTPLWQQFTPTVFNRLWNALGPEQRTSELASTTMAAIKYLDYAGYTLPNNATPEQTEKYVSRVQNWARSLLIVRALLGFVLPATPTAQLDPRGLDGRLRQLMNQMTYTHAVAEFIRENPTATAYTVSESQNETAGYTPATAASLKWLDEHSGFASRYPLAAAWFIPHSGDGYTPNAYREQIALGMRQLRPVSTTSASDPGFLQEVVMARASNIYYTTLTRYEKAYTATTSSQEHQTLTNWWDHWKADFFKINPIFGNYVTSQASHIRRMNVIDQLEQALTAPDAPKGPQTDEMRTLVGQYQAFVSAYTAQIGEYSSSVTLTRRQLKAAMVTWGNGYAKAHPRIADFWNTVIRIEVEDQK